MLDDKVFDNSDALVGDKEWGDVDYRNLEAPYRWRFDEETGKLHMLFQDGKVPRLLCSSAILGKDNDFYRIATLASSQEVLLWYTNHSNKLDASMKR